MRAVAYSRTRLFVYAGLIFGLGLLAGVLLQKYFPLGNVVRAAGIPYNLPEPATGALAPVDRPETPLSALGSGRVMVAVVFGQSNAANWGETPRAATGPVYNFYDGKLYRAKDPLLGASGRGGSVWTRLGDEIVERGLYDIVVFVPLGQASTEIARWAPAGDLHGRIIKSLDQLNEIGLPVTHLLWHQGEDDAGRKTTKAAYKAAFMEMLASIRDKGVTAPIFVSIATRCQALRGDREIQEAQAELVDITQGIYPGPNTDLLGFAYRYDGCHFSNEGLEEAAGLWLQALEAQPLESRHD